MAMTASFEQGATARRRPSDAPGRGGHVAIANRIGLGLGVGLGLFEPSQAVLAGAWTLEAGTGQALVGGTELERRAPVPRVRYD